MPMSIKYNQYSIYTPVLLQEMNVSMYCVFSITGVGIHDHSRGDCLHCFLAWGFAHIAQREELSCLGVYSDRYQYHISLDTMKLTTCMLIKRNVANAQIIHIMITFESLPIKIQCVRSKNECMPSTKWKKLMQKQQLLMKG